MQSSGTTNHGSTGVRLKEYWINLIMMDFILQMMDFMRNVLLTSMIFSRRESRSG